MDEGNPVRSLALSDEENVIAKKLFLLAAKPVLYIANVDENGLDHNPLLDSVREYAKKENSEIVAICAEITTRANKLNQSFQAVVRIQSLFRGKLQQRWLRSSLQAQSALRLSAPAFCLALAKKGDWETLNLFSKYMDNKQFVEAAQIVDEQKGLLSAKP